MSDIIALDPRVQWLQTRREGIGASDAAAIAGVSPFSSAYLVWLEKTGVLPLQAQEDPQQRWGRYLEPAVATAFEAETGFGVINRGVQVVHPDHPWMRATLDGRVADGPAVLGIYEGKTTNGRDNTWKDGVPEHYLLQCQHQMAVDGQERAWVPVLLGGSDFEIFEVPRDDRIIRLLIEIEATFWETNVLGGVQPPIDDSDRTEEALRRIFPRPERERVELPPAAEIALRYRQHTNVAKAAEGLAQKAKNELMALMGDAGVAVCEGRIVASWKLVTSRTLDQDALREAHPEICKEFTRETSYRRLWVPKEKESK